MIGDLIVEVCCSRRDLAERTAGITPRRATTPKWPTPSRRHARARGPAPGLRIGEASAVTWDALDLDAGTVEVRGTVIRVKGEGLRIKWRPKSKSGYRTLELPGWAVEMLRRRQRECTSENAWNVVFTAPAGGLRDPSNTQADLREIFAAAEYEWVTSHVYRKTVATLMDNAGLTARQAADQLGHAKVSMTQDNYFGRRTASTGAAEVLSALARPGEELKSGS